jgi:hypothetical protein
MSPIISHEGLRLCPPQRRSVPTPASRPLLAPWPRPGQRLGAADAAPPGNSCGRFESLHFIFAAVTAVLVWRALPAAAVRGILRQLPT